jgi:hypothetical protein
MFFNSKNFLPGIVYVHGQILNEIAFRIKRLVRSIHKSYRLALVRLTKRIKP